MSQEKKVNLFLRFRPLMPIEKIIPEEEKSSIINIKSDNTVNLENNKSFKFDRILILAFLNKKYLLILQKI